MTDPNLPARLGAALGYLVEALSVGDRIRSAYAAKHGTCTDCGAPLGGPSPSRICESCHAGRVLAEGLGGGEAGDA